MPFSGSGTFTLVAGNPFVTGTVISSTVMNNTMTDFASGFTNCVTRNGQSTALANLPMGGFKHTGAAPGTATGEYLTFGQTAGNMSSATIGTLSVTGNTNINGNTTIGDAGTDTLTVNPSAVTWSGNPTHSGTHTWSGVQTYGADPAGRVVSATYTPTLTNSTNVPTSSVNGVWKYTRVGRVVQVWGRLNASFSNGSSFSRLYVSLPVASTFTSTVDATGLAGLSQTLAGERFGEVLADTISNRGELNWQGGPGVTASTGFIVQFSYEVK